MSKNRQNTPKKRENKTFLSISNFQLSPEKERIFENEMNDAVYDCEQQTRKKRQKLKIAGKLRKLNCLICNIMLRNKLSAVFYTLPLNVVFLI